MKESESRGCEVRYNEYLTILKESPAFREAFDETCREFQVDQEDLMPLDSRLYLMVFAPALVSFVDWVLEQTVMTGKNRLYFLSRDGYQMYLIARQLAVYKNIDIECRYLHASRYSMRLPGYHLNMENCLDSICVGGIDVTLRKMLKRGGLTEKECDSVIKELNMEETQDKFMNYRQVRRLRVRLAESGRLLQYIQKHSVEAYDNAIGYLRQEGLCRDDRFAIVDSGWIGTLQCAVETLVQSIDPDIRVEGYYFGMYDYPRGVGREQFHTYFFSVERGLARKACFSNSLFETVVSAEEGMTLSYGVEGGKYFPILREQNNPNAGQLTQNVKVLQLYLKHLLPEKGSHEARMYDIKAADKKCDGRLTGKLMKKFMSEPTALEYECYGKNLFSDDVTDDAQKKVAAELTWKEIRDQRFLNKLLIMGGLKKAVIRESAWLEGSAFGTLGEGRRLLSELRHIRRYKYFVSFRKLWACHCCGR